MDEPRRLIDQWTIVEEPRASVYVGLLTHVSSWAATASLVVRSGPESVPMKQLRAELAPLGLEEQTTDEWPGTRLHDGVVRVWRFRYDHVAIDLLARWSPSLYGWREPDLPEDLALYRSDGSVLLGSISHEEDAFVRLSRSEREALTALVPGLRISDSPDGI